ncbi:MAG: CDP-2,3-bis-(O-geranylgeranyl)-sn-glycerol synthase [archaeon]
MLVDAFLFIIPAYVANASPVLFGGGRPLDFGKKFRDGRPILGKGKTIRGTVLGILCGTAAYFLSAPFLAAYPLASQLTAGSAFLLASGTIFGDIFGSFIKRRLGFTSGANASILDQIMFIIFALLFVSIRIHVNPVQAAFLILVTPLIHRSFNILAYLAKLKEVPY